jgi:hypothetical protein
MRHAGANRTPWRSSPQQKVALVPVIERVIVRPFDRWGIPRFWARFGGYFAYDWPWEEQLEIEKVTEVNEGELAWVEIYLAETAAEPSDPIHGSVLAVRRLDDEARTLLARVRAGLSDEVEAALQLVAMNSRAVHYRNTRLRSCAFRKYDC